MDPDLSLTQKVCHPQCLIEDSFCLGNNAAKNSY